MKDKWVSKLIAWLWSNFPFTQLNVGFGPGMENGIAEVVSRWAVMGGNSTGSMFEEKMDDVAVITTKKWSRLHEGHTKVSTMIHQEKNLKTEVTMREMKKKLKTCH